MLSVPPVMLGYERVSSPSTVGDGGISIHEHVTATTLHPATHPTLARLRSYLALTLDEEGKSRVKSMRTRSRCRIYDLRTMTGTPSYRRQKSGLVPLKCIMNIVAFNFMDHSRGCQDSGDTKPPCGLEATRAYSTLHETTLAPMIG